MHPRPGEIWLADLGLAPKTRPVMIVSRFDPDAPKALITGVPLTTQNPEQFRAIGWCGGRLCSVIFEIRQDAEGEYYHLVTVWKATLEEERSYAENV